MKSPKRQQISKELLRSIAEGEYVEGQRPPSEADLYARLLRVPLTTVRQPCQYIGAAALRAMRERIAQPDLPARGVVFECKLIVRESCGANLPGHSGALG